MEATGKLNKGYVTKQNGRNREELKECFRQTLGKPVGRWWSGHVQVEAAERVRHKGFSECLTHLHH